MDVYEEMPYGNVITVNGYLTLIDSVGSRTVTGGSNSGSGGGIVNNGTLLMQAGPSIVWNVAREAGGVYNAEDAVFMMSGGRIAHNRSSRYNGGGTVCVYGAAGSTVEYYCAGNNELIFIACDE